MAQLMSSSSTASLPEFTVHQTEDCIVYEASRSSRQQIKVSLAFLRTSCHHLCCYPYIWALHFHLMKSQGLAYVSLFRPAEAVSPSRFTQTHCTPSCIEQHLPAFQYGSMDVGFTRA